MISKNDAFVTLFAAAIGFLGAIDTAPALAEPREYVIVTVHVDGNTGLTASADHPAEAFPSEPVPPGGGMILTKPNAEGKWRMRAFVFHPAQIVVLQGDEVKLTFVGVQGPAHRVKVDGVADEIGFKRGEVRSVVIKADKPGTIAYTGIGRLPSMRGEIVVLPR